MPLHRKMILMTLVLFSVLLGLVYLLEFSHTRDYLAKQMTNDVENTLNSLGLSLIPHLQEGDLPAAETTINAVFDSGNYLAIRYEGVEGKAPVERRHSATQRAVPRWFTDLDLFAPVQRRNALTSGWEPLGQLQITGDPAHAYEQLWRLSTQILLWFLIATLVVVLLLLFTTRRLFRPLVDIEARAREIAEQKFSHPLPDPELVELKSLVRTFNAMSQRLQNLFNRQAEETETLRRAAYQDGLTGLGNRAFFDSELQQWMAESIEGGLLFVHLYYLDRIYNEQGFARRDQLVNDVAEQLRCMRRVNPSLVLARVSEAELALVAPGCDRRQLQAIVEELDQRVAGVTQAFAERFGPMHAIGATERVAGIAAGDMLARADSALQQAWLDNTCAYRLLSDSGDQPVLGRSKWRELVLEAVDQGGLLYQLQPVMAMNGKMTGLELFSAISHLGQSYPATQFMPFVEQYQLGSAYDRHVLQHVAPYVAKHRVPVVVNLSESAIGDAAFVNWLCQWLENDIPLCRMLGFELPEAAMVGQPGGLKALAAQFRRLDVRFGFDRIGRHLEQLKQLVEVGPSYFKVDRSLVLCSEEEDKGFLKSLARLAHDQDIELICLRIENERQLVELAEKPVDGYQGYLREPISWRPGGHQD